MKVLLTHQNSKLPTKAHKTDACFDLYARLDAPIFILPNSTVSIPLGIKTEIPEGYFCAVFPRSGLGIKKGLRLANSTGIIDADYRGEWICALHNDSESSWTIEPGERICQFAILPVIDCELKPVEELTTTERGEGGFGSSGKN